MRITPLRQRVLSVLLLIYAPGIISEYGDLHLQWRLIYIYGGMGGSRTPHETLKGTVGLNSSDPACVEWRVRFTTVPCKPLTDQGCLIYPH